MKELKDLVPPSELCKQAAELIGDTALIWGYPYTGIEPIGEPQVINPEQEAAWHKVAPRPDAVRAAGDDQPN